MKDSMQAVRGTSLYQEQGVGSESAETGQLFAWRGAFGPCVILFGMGWGQKSTRATFTTTQSMVKKEKNILSMGS